MEKQTKSCLIISGGDFSPLPPDYPGADYVIACDKGYEYASRLGLVPDLIIGDFDSAPPPETDVPVERVPTRKDDTDTMLVARAALARGCGEIAICCALGGRMDHSLANIQTAAWVAAHDGRASLFGTDTRIRVFSGGTERFPRREGWSLSLFALSDACEGVTVRGTKYPCENVTLTNAFPLGVSNVWASGCAEVSVGSGILMAVQSRLRPGEHI